MKLQWSLFNVELAYYKCNTFNIPVSKKVYYSYYYYYYYY